MALSAIKRITQLWSTRAKKIVHSAKNSVYNNPK